ncbi:hypothetical protein ACFL2S_05615 [Thermodesulfobacteriota bacterium]
MDENAVEKIKTEIEEYINLIRKFETTLNNDCQEGLYDNLRKLHHFVNNFAKWVSSQIRTQFEDDTERKVRAILDAGFSFKSIALDGVKFQIYNEGNIKKCPDDNFPF